MIDGQSLPASPYSTCKWVSGLLLMHWPRGNQKVDSFLIRNMLLIIFLKPVSTGTETDQLLAIAISPRNSVAACTTPHTTKYCDLHVRRQERRPEDKISLALVQWPLEAVFVVSGDNLHHPFIIITVSSPRTRLFMRDRLEESEQEREIEKDGVQGGH